MIKTDSPTFLHKLCEYFANIGANMARNVPKSSNNFKVFSQSSKESFVLHYIHNTSQVSVSSILSSHEKTRNPATPATCRYLRCVVNVMLLLSQLSVSFVLQEISEEDVNSSIDKIKIASSKGIDEILNYQNL